MNLRSNKKMSQTIISTVFLFISLNSLVVCQTYLGSCDYQRYTVNGCEDELGAECDTTTSQCRCKSGNWVVLDKRFCFPKQCPRGQYYDHNYARCEPQRKASPISEENYCKHDFHCRGEDIHCQPVNDWNLVCVCKHGFLYDTTTQECQKIHGLNGFCHSDDDCDETRLRNLVCVNHSCQCKTDFTYNTNIDGCEANADIQQRDSQTRKMMFLFIGLGLFFGAALSLKFGSNSAAATQQMLLKQVIERRAKERDQQRELRQQRVEEQEQQEQLQSEIGIDLELTQTTDKKENLIDKRETA